MFLEWSKWDIMLALHILDKPSVICITNDAFFTHPYMRRIPFIQRRNHEEVS